MASGFGLARRGGAAGDREQMAIVIERDGDNHRTRRTNSVAVARRHPRKEGGAASALTRSDDSQNLTDARVCRHATNRQRPSFRRGSRTSGRHCRGLCLKKFHSDWQWRGMRCRSSFLRLCRRDGPDHFPAGRARATRMRKLQHVLQSLRHSRNRKAGGTVVPALPPRGRLLDLSGSTADVPRLRLLLADRSHHA